MKIENKARKIIKTTKWLDRAGRFAIINLLISPRSRLCWDRGFV
ncbi:MAG: hypothetical protein UR22_C0029G0008 [Parcubacteria group bacterium GW2011_GWC2_32_10]|nr:MAG: hypothetical protein UR22_C0029G0008 [Parcubacteria group bacterium GW2011_GWC2_32_10]